MNHEPTSVMDELDAEIAYMDAINATASANQLRSIRTRVAALVEAADRFDFGPIDNGKPDARLTTVILPIGDFRTLSAALLPFKGEK